MLCGWLTAWKAIFCEMRWHGLARTLGTASEGRAGTSSVLPWDSLMPSDPHHLQRFLDAQATVYSQVLSELRAAQKRSHWMWFIFPQIRGLGSSPTARHFAIAGREEATAYLAHPVLGPRLRECTTLVLAGPSQRAVEQIFGYPDDLKFHSSMTLFAHTAPDRGLFDQALERFFDGREDRATLDRL